MIDWFSLVGGSAIDLTLKVIAFDQIWNTFSSPLIPLVKLENVLFNRLVRKATTIPEPLPLHFPTGSTRKNPVGS